VLSRPSGKGKKEGGGGNKDELGERFQPGQWTRERRTEKETALSKLKSPKREGGGGRIVSSVYPSESNQWSGLIAGFPGRGGNDLS